MDGEADFKLSYRGSWGQEAMWDEGRRGPTNHKEP